MNKYRKEVIKTAKLNENLASVKKLESDIQGMKFLSMFLPKKKREALKNMEKNLTNLKRIINLFNKYFSDLGWCSYDRMNTTLMEKAIDVYEKEGAEAGEKVLIKYYTKDVRSEVSRLIHQAMPFTERQNLIYKAFEDHFAERYHASVPLFLIIIDGAVNDFTKSKGFFADNTDVTAWDCIVGCDDGLTKMKNIFNKGRNKTNNEEIRMPYRNGILHGRDLNFANAYVSCKCVSLMFALADWMSYKSSEEKRKEDFNRKTNPPPLTETLKKLKQNQKERQEISEWTKRTIIVGNNFPSVPTVDDCKQHPYILPIIYAFTYWKSKNYGELSKVFKNIFSKDLSDGKRAGECRKLFMPKEFISFELKEIEERACSLTRILVQVCWKSDDKMHSEIFEFGCVYERFNGQTGLPWRNDGEWVLIPWNIMGLYKV